jgi:hypothetical protein
MKVDDTVWFDLLVMAKVRDVQGLADTDWAASFPSECSSV